MVMDWPWLWTSAQVAVIATVVAFPLAFALGWRIAFDARHGRWARVAVQVVRLAPALVLLAAWRFGSVGWMLAAAVLVAAASLAREVSVRLAALPAPWFESLATLGAPGYRAAWPAVRVGLFGAAAWVAGRVFLEAVAGLILRGRG
jgi:ABC-type amino acid transport system permease subunit